MKNNMWGILLGIAVALVVILVVLPVLFMAMMSIGGMMGFGGMSGIMGQSGSILWPGWLMLVFGLLVVAGLVLLVVWGARRFALPNDSAARETPLAILQRRYARGEIGREEYEGAREILLRDGGDR
jgi:putative membrane protein